MTSGSDGHGIAVAIVGLTGTIVLQYVAFSTAPLVAANAIAYAWPLFAAAWAALAPGARGSRTSLALAMVGFSGVVLLFATRDGAGSPGGAALLGYLAALASAVAMVSYTLTAGRSGARTSDLLLVGTGAGALGTIPAALLEGASWSPAWAVLISLAIGVAMLALGYGLWTRAMAHPAGARLAPAAYAMPLLSTGLLLGCALIVLCAAGVVVDALVPRGQRAAPAGAGSAGRAKSSRRRPSVA